ncbi:MAG: MSCRAMM family protein, partial [Candidatus Rifleibacteriota bacterium]
KIITSLEAEYVPDERSSLKFEGGQSRFTSGNSQKDNAYRIQYSSELREKVRLTFDKIHAGPDYAGSVRDMDHTYVALEFPILSWVNGRARYSQYENNLKFDKHRGSSPQENLWQFGLNFQLRHGINFSFDFDRMHRYDRLIPANFDISEKAYRATLGKRWKRFELRWEVRHRRRSELVSAQETWNDSHSYFAVFRPSARFFLSVYGGFSKNNGRAGSYVLRDFANLGISSRWHPSERLSLSFWYSKYNYSGVRRQNSQGNFGLEYKLPNDSSIIFKARNNVSWIAENGPVFYELSYSIPIDIPIGKNSKIGNLSGKIVDGELPDKPGIADIIVIMGNTAAVTNKSGQFVFPAMTCGTHTLTIERESVGFNRISSIKLPAEIMIKGGKTSKIEIAMLKGAKLNGRFVSSSVRHGVSSASGDAILTGDVGQSLEKSPVAGLANILVELSQANKTTRRASDNYGEFQFDSLKPGTWHYKVYEHNLPENHRVKNGEGEITFAAGESKELLLEVVPRRRSIQIIDEGVIKLNLDPELKD